MSVKHNILLVDDNEADHFYNEIMFEHTKNACQLIKVYDGLEAMEAIEKAQSPFSLILLDINMPRMNGREFLRAYMETTPGTIPVIVMLTSSDQTQDIRDTQQYPCVIEYFTKPLTPEKLEKIDEILANLDISAA